MIRKLLMGLALLPMSVLATTLSVDGYAFTTGGDADWYVDSSFSYDGKGSIRSGSIGHEESTWLRLDVYVGGDEDRVLSFRWNVSSEGTCDPLCWYLDGVVQAKIGGENNSWGLQTVVLSPGAHVIKWEYSKDDEEWEGEDCGWIDTLTIAALDTTPPKTYFVNGKTGSDSYDGSSSSSAKATIQAAIDVAKDCDTILVSPGTYAPISAWNKAILIRGIEGAEKTFIDGGNTTTCAKLCVNGDSGAGTDGRRTTLEGFTLQNGSSNGLSDGWCSAVYRGTIKKCIVRSCRAYDYYGRVSICNGCAVSDTLAYGNACDSYAYAVSQMYGGVFKDADVVNCTVVSNQCYGLYNSKAWNTISWNNTYGGRVCDVDFTSSTKGFLNYCLTQERISAGEGNITGVPQFVNVTNNDYRLKAWSIGVDAGSNAHVTNATDLAGCARIADGTVDIGCYEYCPSPSKPILYVDGETGSDENEGRSKLTAKKTIQAAIDVANDGDTIVVADGTYDAIAVPGWRGIVIRSMNGAATTIIDGKDNASLANFCSDDASYKTGGVPNQIVGFTLQHGRATASYSCGVLRYGIAVNCVLRNNYGSGFGSGSVVYVGSLINCIIYGNEFGNYAGGIACNSSLFNCTMCDNAASYGLWDCTVYNSISHNSGSEYRSSGLSNTYHNSLTKLGLDPGQGNITGDPLFKDAANANFSLLRESPCVNTGDISWYDSGITYSDYKIPSEYFTTDIFGNPRDSGANVDMGAIEKVIRNDGGPYTELVDGIEWTFRVYNGQSTIGLGSDAAISTSTSGKIVVPDELGGHPVVSINSYAFSGCSAITSVEIPSTVSNVYKRAFSYCTSLGDVTFPASLTYLDNATFRYASNVTNITCLGDAPDMDDEEFKYPTPNFTVSVQWKTKGWDDDGDGKWKGRTLLYYDCPYGPELVAWYKFDGSLADSSGHECTLHSNKAEAYAYDRFGKENSAYWLDGSTALFESTTKEGGVSWETNYTFSCWIRATEETKLYDVSSSGIYGTSSSIKYLCGQTDLPVAIGINGINVFEHANYFLPAVFKYEELIGDGWRHLVITVSEDVDVVLYLDGRTIGSFSKQKSQYHAYLGLGNYDTGAPSGLDACGIGAFAYGGHFKGGVDDARFYNRALSADEVRALYEEERADDWVFTCTQYSFNTRPTSLSQAESFITDASKIAEAPVTKYYNAIAFGDNIEKLPMFPTVSFPGNGSSKAEYFAMTSSARLFVPSAGKWTFCCGSDDGFRVRITRDGYLDEFSFGDERAFDMSFKTFDFPVGGIYDLNLSYYEQGVNAICELSTAKGTYSSFDASAFKLVGTVESGIIVVGPNTRTVSFDALGGGVSNECSIVESGNAIGALPVPTRVGYDFDGWYTAIEGGERIAEQTIVLNDMVAYARWIAIAYNITYNDLRGVENPNPATYTIEDTIVFAPLSDIDEIHFMGWDVPGITLGTTGDVVVTAQWKNVSVGNVTGATNVLWRTGGDAPWATEETAEGWDVRSGAIDRNSETWVECVVTNGCRVSFEWKVSCEPEDEGEMYDFLSFSIDGDQKAAICGESGWTNDVHVVSGSGEHILRWTYQKDNRTTAGEDCGWLGRVRVDPEVPVTFDGNGATSGEVPTIPTAYLGDTITVPGKGTLVKSCHAFGGWEYGETTYQEGAAFTLGTNAVEFVAVWNAKVLGLPILVSPATPHVTTEKIAVSLQTPASAQGIRYTLDGTEPTAESAVYTGPFEIEDRAVTVKAVAFADDWFDSACATWELTRAPWSAAECLNAETREFSFGGKADWVRDLSVTHDGEAAMCSGTITDKQTSQILMPVTGEGTVSFWCKVSSEWDPETKEVYDGLAIAIDGKDVYPDLIGGEVGWTNITVGVSGAGEHVISWRYQKDKVESAGSDCAWIDEVLWQVNETVVPAAITGDRDLPISRNWIEKDIVDRYGPGKTEAFRNIYGNDYDLAVLMPDGKTINGSPCYVWQDYVAGTDPTDADSVFASAIVMQDGVPVVTWEPDLKDARTYKVWGSTNLVNGGDWEWPTNALHRFFKVTVEMK